MSALLPALTADSWALLKEQATLALQSGYLPAHIKTGPQAIMIAAKGAELGIPPLYALSNIGVINGKPVCSAELMLALIYRDHGDEAIRVVETTDERATIAYRRRAWPAPQRFTFSSADAQRAQLGGNQWQKYPAAMLRARAISAVARMAFPDSIGGMFSPDELGGAVQVTADGTVELADEQPTATNGTGGGHAPDRDATPEPATDREAKKAAVKARFEELAAEWRRLDPDVEIPAMAGTVRAVEAQILQLQEAVDALAAESPF